jgi:hypothetical protein
MLKLVKDEDNPTQKEEVSSTKETEPSDLERAMRDEYSKKKQRLTTMRADNNKSVTRQYRLKK